MILLTCVIISVDERGRTCLATTVADEDTLAFLLQGPARLAGSTPALRLLELRE